MERSAATVDRMLVVVFDSEPKAYEGKRALLQLESEGSIVVYAGAVIAKNAAGDVTVKQSNDSGPLGTLVGTSLGSVIGLLGGPTGVAIGGTVFRRALSAVKDMVDDEDTAAMKADLAQLKAERAKARADWKGKLQEKINQLDTKIQARLEKAKERRQAAEQRAKAKAEILKTKAAALKAKAAQAGDVVPD